MAHGEALLQIEVAYSPRAGEMDHTQLRLPPGATLSDALVASGLLSRHPEAGALPDGVQARDVCRV